MVNFVPIIQLLMEHWKEIIDSGILELYVLGDTDAQESQLVELMVVNYPEIRAEIANIELALEQLALSQQVKPDPIIKPFLMATIDFTDRMKSGEEPVAAPELTVDSVPTDYARWLDRSDLSDPGDFSDVFAKILSYTPEAITAVVWIRDMAPQEVHDHEFERFLILEGTCEIHVEDEVHYLSPGSYFQIPLHKRHHVLVTSNRPCKVILQRVAA